MPAVPEGGQEPARAQHQPAAQHEPQVVPEPRGLHHGQVRHVHVRPGHGRRVPTRRHRRQRSLAQNGYEPAHLHDCQSSVSVHRLD